MEKSSKQKPRSLSTKDLGKDISLKCVIVGDLLVRKNELLNSHRMSEDSQELDLQSYIPWIIDNYCKKIEINNRTVSLTMWDTSGQEDLSELRKLSYLSADVIFIVFNLYDKSSFENAFNKWYEEIKKYKSDLTLIFLGNCQKPEGADEIMVPDPKKLFMEKGLTYLECESFSPDIISKVISDSIAIYIKQMDHKIKHKKKCVLI